MHLSLFKASLWLKNSKQPFQGKFKVFDLGEKQKKHQLMKKALNLFPIKNFIQENVNFFFFLTTLSPLKHSNINSLSQHTQTHIYTHTYTNTNVQTHTYTYTHLLHKPTHTNKHIITFMKIIKCKLQVFQVCKKKSKVISTIFRG